MSIQVKVTVEKNNVFPRFVKSKLTGNIILLSSEFSGIFIANNSSNPIQDYGIGQHVYFNSKNEYEEIHGKIEITF